MLCISDFYTIREKGRALFFWLSIYGSHVTPDLL